jgi:DNA-directed RNA polymerase alpha subunit
MFKDGLRALRSETGENYLRVCSSECRHKVDSIVLHQSGLTDLESQALFSELQVTDVKEFEIRQLESLNPKSITHIASKSLCRSLIIWARLNRLIELHVNSCDASSAQPSEYVDVSDFGALRQNFPISDLALSSRCMKVLSREGIHSFYQLSQIPRNELYLIQGLGAGSVNEIVKLLDRMELNFTEDLTRGNSVRSARSKSLESLNLSTKTYNALKRIGIQNLGELLSLTQGQLSGIRNFGEKSMREVQVILADHTLFGGHSAEDLTLGKSDSFTKSVELENLNLSTKTYNALKRSGIQDLSELSNLMESELRDVRHFGEKSVLEVKEMIARHAGGDALEGDVVAESEEVSSEALYDWVSRELAEDLDLFSKGIQKFGDVKINFQTTGSSMSPHKNYLLYTGIDSISDVTTELNKQLQEALDAESVESFILNFDAFTQDLLSYQNFHLECMPTKSQRESLLKYRNDHSDGSVDLLKFDVFTLKILGIHEGRSDLYLGKDTYFELLDSVGEFFILDSKVWDVIKGVVSFHQTHGTFPNISGLIIAHQFGSETQKNHIYRELEYLLESLTSDSGKRKLIILEMRINGRTLDEIGKSVGVTRERVRQILSSISPELNKTIEALKLGAQEKHVTLTDAKFLEIFREYGAIYKNELALELGVTETVALKSIPKNFNKFIIDKVPEPVTNLLWSKTDCLNSIRKAGTYFFPIRQADYDHLVNIGEIKGPSVAYMTLRYGQWSELCIEAGVECVQSVRSQYARTWSDEELLSYVRRFFLEPDTSGSYGGYDSWRERQTDHVPSGILIRNVFGSWTTVKRKVLEGLRLEKGLEVRSDI